MNKKTDKKTILVGIGLLFAVIFGCVSIVMDSIPDKGNTDVPLTPLSLQIQGWESQKIENLCLEVKQSYPEEWFGFFKETLENLGMNITPRQYNFPYDELIREILQKIEVTVVDPDAQCDAVLEIKVTGDALSRRYGHIITRRGNSQCYLSASVSGSLTLTSENQETFQTTFKGHISAPETTQASNCPDQPYKAPFDEPSAEALIDALVQLWGPEIASTISSIYSGYGKSSEEAMHDAANQFVRGEVAPRPTDIPPEPPTTPVP